MTVDLDVESALKTDRGRKRDHNEDFIAFFEPDSAQELEKNGRIYVVADGVGGAARGERASKYAAQKVIFEYFNDPDHDVGARLRRAIRRAGNDIYEHAARSERLSKMATTMVAAVIRNDSLAVANVGDSRAYLIRGGKARQITRDHTIAGEMLRDGEIDEVQALRVKGKNRLTRSLGGEPDVQVDVFQDIQLAAGDRVLLCSDGLTRYALADDIAHLTTNGDLGDVVESCVAFANQHGGADKVSAVVIGIGGPASIPEISVRPRGDLPTPVDWDEMVTEPSLRPVRRRRRSTRSYRDWALLGAAGVAVVAIAWFLGSWLANIVVPGAGPAATRTLASVVLDTTQSRDGAPGVLLPPQETGPPSTSPSDKTPSPAETMQASPTGIPAGEISVSPVDDMKIAFVPAGEFLMGSTEDDQTAYEDEKPQHAVALGGFWMDLTEVTNAQYAKCVAAGACQQPASTASPPYTDYYTSEAYSAYPIVNITWAQAQAYCAWAGRRLPTEAEWEKAARGTDGRTYPWGNKEPDCSLLNFGNCQEGGPSRIGSYPADASPYGVLDMAGNVWEWVNDWYQSDYYVVSPSTEPQGPDQGTSRILRGGSCCDPDPDSQRYLRAANRGVAEPDSIRQDFGFRCAKGSLD